MPELKSLSDIDHWVHQHSPMDGFALSVRAGLRCLPSISKEIDTSRRGKDWRNPIVLESILGAFRKLCVNWMIVKYPYRFAEFEKHIRAANSIKFDHLISRSGPATQDTLRSVHLSLQAVLSGSRSEIVESIICSLGAIGRVDRNPSEALSAISSDSEGIDSFLSSSALADSPIWLNGVPTPIIRAWNPLRGFLLTHAEDWQVWTDWYAARRDGRRVWRQSIEIARATLDDAKFWSAGPKVVNGEIQRIIHAEKAKLRDRTKDPSSDTTIVLAQRPSSHSFAWKSETIEALPVSEPPFDAVLASTIMSELREKADAVSALMVGNNSDPVVVKSIERLRELISGSVDSVSEGILLMRSHTIAAHARAYSDASSDRDRSIKALLDDFSMSVGSLLDCYQGVRQINANRLALDLQADHAIDVQQKLAEISKIASKNSVVGMTAKKALSSGQEEITDLNEKISFETNLDKAANYLSARGQTIAARLLDATNFVSATILKLSNEIAGLGEDTWKETRKTLPKSIAKGVSSGVETGLRHSSETLLLLLATHIAGPWGGIAVLVPRLTSHSKKINQVIKDAEDLSESELSKEELPGSTS